MGTTPEQLVTESIDKSARPRWIGGQCQIVNHFGHVLGAASHDRNRPFAEIEAAAWHDALKKQPASHHDRIDRLERG